MYGQWWMGMLVLVAHSRDHPWGGLESLSHAVPQWVCGGWVILNDLLTNYILFSGSTFWEGLQWPGQDSQVILFYVLECTSVTLRAWSTP